MKKKILFIIPSLVGGGAERTLINLLKQIDFTKYDIDLISILKKGPLINQIPKEVNFCTAYNNEWLLRFYSFIQKKYGFKYFIRKRFNKLIRQDYQVGISFLDSNFTDYLFFTDKIKKRYCWVHSSYQSYDNFWKYYKNNKYRDYLIQERYSKLDGIYFVSNDAMSEFVEVFGTYNEMKVIYNIIDNDYIKLRSRETIDFQKQEFTFIAVGSLLPVKGFDRLIRAAKIISDKGYNFRINILGSGPERKKLQDYISSSGLDEKVCLIGFVKNPYPYISQADTFIMSSVSEALPTVLCEAMILHKPTLVTNCSGCREIVNYGEYGLMAEQNDHDLAEKMITLLTNNKVLDHYTVQSVKRSTIFNDEKVLSEYYSVFEK